jgi:hypothetical protein
VNDVRHFALDLYAYKIGQNADIGVLRDGKTQTVSVSVMERPNDPQRFADMVTGPDNLVNRLGIVAVTMNDQLRDALGDVRINSGVLVAARTPTSTLLGDGPQPGDNIKSGDTIVLQIERSGLLSYLVLESE